MNFDRLTAYLDGLYGTYGIHGSDIRITKDHQTVYRHQSGFCDYADTVPVTENNLYYIYSASKVITMTAAMQLIEQGLLGLDEPVSKYLPAFTFMRVADHYDIHEFPPKIPKQDDPCHPARNPILIRNLMSMTAGLSYNTTGEPILALREATKGRACTYEMVSAIAQMPLLFEPGTHYSYSLGHDVIAAVIEVITRKRFRDYLQENIFEPLGIRDIWIHLPESEKSRLMAQYTGSFTSDEIKPAAQNNSFCLSDEYDSGGAGLVCSVDAYSTVIDALANGGVGANGVRILKEESVRRMSENQLGPDMIGDFQLPWRMEYGYGLGVRTLVDPSLSPTPLGEFGWDGAAGAYALVDPVNHISIFYAQEVLSFIKAYSEIHPKIRNLAYEAMSL